VKAFPLAALAVLLRAPAVGLPLALIDVNFILCNSIGVLADMSVRCFRPAANIVRLCLEAGGVWARWSRC